MKTSLKSLAIATILLSIAAACQQELEPQAPEQLTHTVTFVAGKPETKTGATIDEENKTVSYYWKATDESADGRTEKFRVFENGTEADCIMASLQDGLMYITATFPGEAASNAEYTAFFNSEVKALQESYTNDYDQYCDVLVAKPTTGDINTGIKFSFKREVAFGKMTLKGLNKGKYVSKVVLEATDGKILAAEYDIENNQFRSTGSSSIELNALVEIAEDKTASLFFVTVPVEDAMLKISVETVDESGATAATYSKTFTKRISFTRGNVKAFGVALEESILPKSWVATDLADLDETMPVVITMTKEGTVYALSLKDTDGNAFGTSTASKAVIVEVNEDQLTTEPTSDILWNIANNAGQLTIYPDGITSKWLYAQDSANDGVRLGDSKSGGYIWSIDESGYLKTNSSESKVRYLGVYKSSSKVDWRSYTSVTGTSNIANQTLCFYTNSTPKTALEAPKNLTVSDTKMVTWDAVDGATSYILTIGSVEYPCGTNSYNASEIVDEYYDVAVVALPTNTELFKKSAPTTLTDAKFGTPTLATPTLKEGSVDEFSINATWTVDLKATSGYNCELYQGETKVGDSKTVKTGSVTFDGLDDGVTYTIKVNAIAVEGTKAYAASDVASINLTTKGTVTLSQITEAGTYTVKNVTVYAVVGKSTAVIGDGTAYFYLYKSSHGLNVGDTFTVGGTVSAFADYGDILEFNNPSISNKVSGSAPVYENAVEADETFLTAYASAPIAEYIHAKGTQSGRNINIGSQKLYLSAANSATDGKDVEVSGFVYGYKSSSKYAYFYATSIAEDPTAPKLSVTPTSKTWAYNETEAATFTVTTNTEGEKDWSVAPETLDWATITVDKEAGTITVKPNGENKSGTDYQATLTVTHAADEAVKQEISLTQETFVSVTGVELDKSELSLAIGKTATLKATITPSNATNKNVTWSSDKESVATVVDGVVTAVAEGTAIITVKTEDGESSAICTINVTAVSTWVLVEQLSGLSNGTYIISARYNSEYYAVPNTTINAQTFTCIKGEYDSNNKTLTPADGSGEFEFIPVDGVDNAFYIYNTNLNKYLAATGSKTFGYVDSSSTNYGYWTFSTVDGGGFSGTYSVKHSSKTHYMRAYNNSVKCYDSLSNQGVYFFKKK